MNKSKVLICPYCGETQPAEERCRGCGGLFEPLSRQATHNAMGPWFVRDAGKPFQPGCSYETMARMIDRGQITKYSILRGPTTKQFWTVAKHVPGVSHLLGYCHNCDASVDPGDHGCHVCGAAFGAYLDRNYLGLPDVRAMPWEAGIEGQDGARVGGGLSRFASDEELLGAAVPPPMPARQVEIETAIETEDPHSSPVARSLRRKLANQQRLINILVTAMVIITILSILSNLDRFGRQTEPQPQPQLATPVPAPVQPVPLEEEVVEQKPVIEEKPVEPPPPEPVVTTPGDVDEAMTLLVAAAKTDRSLDERIADYEKALELLRAADPDNPAIVNAASELERLTLERDWFGDSDG